MPFCRAAQRILAGLPGRALICHMIDKHPQEASSVWRRIRRSTREIAITVMLTVAALVAIAAVRIGQDTDETAMSRPIVPDRPR